MLGDVRVRMKTVHATFKRKDGQSVDACMHELVCKQAWACACACIHAFMRADLNLCAPIGVCSFFARTCFQCMLASIHVLANCRVHSLIVNLKLVGKEQLELDRLTECNALDVHRAHRMK